MSVHANVRAERALVSQENRYIFFFLRVERVSTETAMPTVKCPINGCGYETIDASDAIVAALIGIHGTTHQASTQSRPKSEACKIKRPSVCTAGTNEEWKYFETRLIEYKQAAKIGADEMVVQLLECCEESLRRDLTRVAGGVSMTHKT